MQVDSKTLEFDGMYWKKLGHNLDTILNQKRPG